MGIIKRFKEQERGVFAGLSTHFPILLINGLCITRFVLMHVVSFVFRFPDESGLSATQYPAAQHAGASVFQGCPGGGLWTAAKVKLDAIFATGHVQVSGFTIFYGIDQTSTPHSIGCAVKSDFESLFRVIYLI